MGSGRESVLPEQAVECSLSIESAKLITRHMTAHVTTAAEMPVKRQSSLLGLQLDVHVAGHPCLCTLEPERAAVNTIPNLM